MEPLAIKDRRYITSITLRPNILRWIDARRGDASRSKFIERVLEREMEREMERENQEKSTTKEKEEEIVK
jgi:hypothetical protein